MSEITIQAGTIENYQGVEAALTMRVYVSRTFTPSTGEAVEGSRIRSTNFYLGVPCTVANHIISYPSFIIDSTIDALANPYDARYSFVLYTPNLEFRGIVYKKLRCPIDTPTNLAALAAYNNPNIPFVPEGSYSISQIDALLAGKADVGEGGTNFGLVIATMSGNVRM